MKFRPVTVMSAGKDLHECADDEHAIDEQDQPREQQAGGEARHVTDARHRRAGNRGGAARHRHEGARSLQPQSKEIEREGEHEQDHADDRRAREIPEAGDQPVRLRRQDGVSPGDQQRVAEVLEDVDRHQQDRGGDAGPGERQCDGAEDGPRIRAEIAGGLFETRIAVRQHVRDQLVGEGEEGDRLHPPEAVAPENERDLVEDIVRDHAARPEEEDVTGRDDEGRRQEGQDTDDAGRTASTASGCRPSRRHRRSRAARRSSSRAA